MAALFFLVVNAPHRTAPPQQVSEKKGDDGGNEVLSVMDNAKISFFHFKARCRSPIKRLPLGAVDSSRSAWLVCRNSLFSLACPACWDDYSLDTLFSWEYEE